MDSANAKFAVGQVVHHRLFDYRGVIVDVDAVFSLSEDWYQSVAKSRPPKDEPWYHVLRDGTTIQTYVAERNLEPDASGRPIRHSEIERHFSGFFDGRYHRRTAFS